MEKKKLVIITSPNGAGLSSAKFVYEENGFFITENPPSESIEAILKSYKGFDNNFTKFCLMIHVKAASGIIKIIKKYEKDFDIDFILLIASKESILSRYALTRHIHPRSILEGISLENAVDEDLVDAKEIVPLADYVLDTSSLSVKELRKALLSELEGEAEEKSNITFMSFGIKNGIPLGLDMVLDTRSLPNPYWVDDLKELTGNDQEVIDYLMSFPETKVLLDEFTRFLTYVLETVKKAARPSYNIGICCSGGQHRSTFVANYLAAYFKNDFAVRVLHRDTPND